MATLVPLLVEADSYVAIEIGVSFAFIVCLNDSSHSFTQDCVCTLYHHINDPVLFFLIYSLVHRLDAKHGTTFVQGRMTQTNLSQKKNKSVVHFERVINMLCPSTR